MTETYEDKVERLARKMMFGGDGNSDAMMDIETARRRARHMLEESEQRTREATDLDPDDDSVIRRSSTETAANGDTSTTGTRYTDDGE
jgi:hypothetical protein